MKTKTKVSLVVGATYLLAVWCSTGATLYPITPSSGGSATNLTPWPSDISGGGHSLQNVAIVSASKVDATNLVFNGVQLPYFKGSAVPVIWDNEFGSDCDQYGAAVTACALDRLGYIKLLCVGTVNDPRSNAAPALRAVLEQYGRGDVAIGTNGTSTITGNWSGVADLVATNWFPYYANDPRANMSDAVTLYRTALATATPGTVHFVTTGQLKNLYDLVNSSADSISASNGLQLIQSRCKEVVILGGNYPLGHDYNFTTDPTSAGVINQLTNVAVVHIGYADGGSPTGPASDYLVGGDLYYQRGLVKQAYEFILTTTNPAIAINRNPNRGREWGSELALMWIPFGTNLFHTNGLGFDTVVPTGPNAGTNYWTVDSTAQQTYINNIASKSNLVLSVANQLLSYPPLIPSGMGITPNVIWSGALAGGNYGNLGGTLIADYTSPQIHFGYGKEMAYASATNASGMAAADRAIVGLEPSSPSLVFGSQRGDMVLRMLGSSNQIVLAGPDGFRRLTVWSNWAVGIPKLESGPPINGGTFITYPTGPQLNWGLSDLKPVMTMGVDGGSTIVTGGTINDYVFRQTNTTGRILFSSAPGDKINESIGNTEHIVNNLLRVTGTGTPSSAGSGLEMAYYGGVMHNTVYNRASDAYVANIFDALSQEFDLSGNKSIYMSRVGTTNSTLLYKGDGVETNLLVDNNQIRANNMVRITGNAGPSLDRSLPALELDYNAGVAEIVSYGAGAYHEIVMNGVVVSYKTSGNLVFSISTNSLNLTKTITPAGTTSSPQTINNISGSVNIAAAGTTVTVNNSLVAATSVIMCTVGSNDTTAKSACAVAGAGSFVITLNAAATAETRVNFLVTN